MEKIRRKKQHFNKKFQPNREFIEKAIIEFLANGGEIICIEAEENSYENFMLSKNDSSTDEFLMGE